MKRIPIIVWVVFGLFLLIGCGFAPQPPAPSESWIKPGLTTAGVAQDSHECQAEANYRACMQQRGYQIKETGR